MGAMPKRFPARNKIEKSFRDLRHRQAMRLRLRARELRKREPRGIHEGARERMYDVHDPDRDAGLEWSDARAMDAAVALDAACDAARLTLQRGRHVDNANAACKRPAAVAPDVRGPLAADANDVCKRPAVIAPDVCGPLATDADVSLDIDMVEAVGHVLGAADVCRTLATDADMPLDVDVADAAGHVLGACGGHVDNANAVCETSVIDAVVVPEVGGALATDADAVLDDDMIEAAEHASGASDGRVGNANEVCEDDDPPPARHMPSAKPGCRRRSGKSKPGNKKRAHWGLEGDAKRRHKWGPSAPIKRAEEWKRRKRQNRHSTHMLAICDGMVAICDGVVADPLSTEHSQPPVREDALATKTQHTGLGSNILDDSQPSRGHGTGVIGDSPPLGQPSPDIITEWQSSCAASSNDVPRLPGDGAISNDGLWQPHFDAEPYQPPRHQQRNVDHLGGGPQGIYGGLLWAITAAHDDQPPVETLGDTQPFYRPPPSPTPSDKEPEAHTVP